ncbi:MAG TPA: hypothetical protein VGS21_07275 [Acidimicrobiales bacterium]|nr:hypothetical protein [Acidimicrobiales bacterium]
MNLATYRSCSFQEKRGVLTAFWSGRVDQPDKVVFAALEYGPYALAMIEVITFELIVIDIALLVYRNGWSWLAIAATLLALWSVRLTSRCDTRIRSLAAARFFQGLVE